MLVVVDTHGVCNHWWSPNATTVGREAIGRGRTANDALPPVRYLRAALRRRLNKRHQRGDHELFTGRNTASPKSCANMAAS